MHRWIATDNGSQCLRCGMVLDYGDTDEFSGVIVPGPATDAAEDRAYSLAFGLCAGPTVGRAHHYVLSERPAEHCAPGSTDTTCTGHGWHDVLECAYGDATVGPSTVPGSVNPECIGA